MAGMVLIVDDEQNVREGLCAYLEDEGFSVVTAASAEEAFQLVDEGADVGAVIMDLRLPRLDGTEAIRTLHAKRPDLRFLIHTGSQGYTPPHDLVKMGITDTSVFRKPVTDMGVIAEALHGLLKGTPDDG